MKKALAGFGAALMLAGIPLAFSATPAEAGTVSKNHCTVTPLKPYHSTTNDFGIKVINYQISVTCKANHTIQLEQRVREDDDHIFGSDGVYGTRTVSRHFSTAGTVVIDGRLQLPATESGNEEMYHDVRFQVLDHPGGWSGRTDSPNGSFAN